MGVWWRVGGIRGFEHPGEEETLKGVCGVRARGASAKLMNGEAEGVKHQRPLAEAEMAGYGETF